MKSKSLILLFGLIFTMWTPIKAQTHKPSVLSSAGTSVTVGNLQVSWTLGETFTQTLTGGSNALTQGFQQVFPSLELNTLGFTSLLCAGKSYSVSYTAILVKNSGNVFTVQLSNATGSFASPVSVGTLASTSSGTIPILIPANTTPGTAYRIRIVSSSPALTSKDNGTNLSIFASPNLTSLDPAQGAISSNILLLGTGLSNVTAVKFNALTTTFKVNSANQITAVVPTGATNGYVVVINSNGCSDTITGFQVVNQVCATPTASPVPGTYGPPPSITLTTTTSGATIYYTTNGTLPGPDNAASKIYTAPFQIAVASATVKARAFKNGFVQSAPFSGVYNVTNICGAITITPGTGNYFGSTLITMTCPTAGATIYYSTTGNVPVPGTTFTKVYTSPFYVNSSVSIRAYATKTDFVQGPTALANLTISTLGVLPNVVFTPPAGTYLNSQTIALSCTEPGTTIYYTTNGNAPLPGTGYTLTYTGPFTQFSSGTIKAFASKLGYTNGAVGTAVYTITNPAVVATPVFSPLPGACGNPCPVTISCATPGAAIWYTTTGNTPDPASPISRLYSTPVLLTATRTVKAKAFLTGYLSSATASGIFTITPGREAVAEEEMEPMEGELSIYPNPSSGSATLTGLPEEGTVTIRIWNSEGKQVATMDHTPSGKTTELDLRNFASGLYQVEVLWEGIRKQVRLIKN
jgi:hypothetical protein